MGAGLNYIHSNWGRENQPLGEAMLPAANDVIKKDVFNKK